MTAARAYRHRKLLPYAAACVALVTLGACTSSDPGPGTTTPAVTSTTTTTATTTTAAPTATTTPTPTATVDPVTAKIPAPARIESVDGSVAFTQFFIGRVNDAFTQGDSSFLDGLFTNSCKACQEFADGADKLKQDGLHHLGVSLKASGASSNQYTAKNRSVAVQVIQNSVPVVDKAGRTVRRTKAGDGTLLATLEYRGSGWVVVNLQVAK